MPRSPVALTPDALAGSIAAAYAAFPAVNAVAMAGSRVSGGDDDDSDLDLYVYAAETISLREREAVASGCASRREIGNTFWEAGDEWIDAATGLHVDVMFRRPAWIEEQLDRVLIRHEAGIGYSTCFWHTVLHATPLFDRAGWYGRLQSAANQPYPEALQRAIVAKNHPILRRSLSSYTRQIERAAGRGDSASVQHRTTALLASYFDILFAVNEMPHPGEKGLLAYALARCRLLPVGMEAGIAALLAVPAWPASTSILAAIDALLDALDALLVQEGLLTATARW